MKIHEVIKLSWKSLCVGAFMCFCAFLLFQIKAEIVGLEKGLYSMETRISDVGGSILAIQSDIDALKNKSRFSAPREIDLELAESIDAIKTEVGFLAEDVTAIRTHTEDTELNVTLSREDIERITKWLDSFYIKRGSDNTLPALVPTVRAITEWIESFPTK